MLIAISPVKLVFTKRVYVLNSPPTESSDQVPIRQIHTEIFIASVPAQENRHRRRATCNLEWCFDTNSREASPNRVLLVNSPNVRLKSCNVISHSYQFEITRGKSQDFLREACKGFNKQRFSRKNDLISSNLFVLRSNLSGRPVRNRGFRLSH